MKPIHQKKSLFIFSIIVLGSLIFFFSCKPLFTEHMLDSNALGTDSLFPADLDNDGDIDIVGALADSSKIVWWENSGTSPIKWTVRNVGSNLFGAKSVYAADIDKDGFLDILGASSDSDEIAWWHNSGTGSKIIWTKYIIRKGYDWAHEVFACDIDKDGDQDVLGASSALNQITLWINQGGDPISWKEVIIEENFTQAKSVTAADIDGDGNIDIAAASLFNHTIKWWKNSGDPEKLWMPNTVTSIFTGAHRVQAVDLDRDGDIDILASGWYANQIAWWRNDGGDPVKWKQQIIGYNFVRTCQAYAADLDGDGDLDVVGTAQDGNQVAWWRNNGGEPIKWEKIILDGNFKRVWPVYAVDLDGDGDMDIIAASGQKGTNKVKWWENNGKGIFIKKK